MTRWEQHRARWEAYKNGIRDKVAGVPAPIAAPLYGRHSKSYLEGFNETNPKKIAKYK